ncbi:hydroxyacid dehydrogenase [Rhodococcus ruber Chol-4]|uniref:2-hydroxyacid dehydrogenase n=1 Tax=Rhodococcus TaxID=1827 RepID=UPI00029A4B0B|nr:2-hydroxyacid dehydrogenase [Rhodococcus ruber]KXF84800.1 hydroxyacid dehydrogenase [Rhodococcus ruber Chol-4]AWH01048.1 2-hydroxyacid dehydrogenase [Rhodococcus ruber]MBD8056229.1 2-hydroxyacid dehydrogenase [Rhodococcus ruber]MCF8785330.1 2-hydroxyacid dehydrogenase [Rhodococcus ruber]
MLVVEPFPAEVAAALSARFDVAVLSDGAARVDDADIVACSSLGTVDAPLMDRLPRLQAVVNLGVGIDNIDVDHAAQRGIGVSNTPGVLDECVADTAVGLLINVVRRFPAADRYVRAGRWAEGLFPTTRNVSGMHIGIVGLGRIGRAVATRLSAFGCPVAYHNRRPDPDVAYPYVDDPIELASRSDALIVAASGSPDNTGMIDRAVLQALGPNGYLINIARGHLVDEQALVDLLGTGGLAGAGLDVYVDEPNVPEPLRRLDNTVLLPHVGSATERTRAAMGELFLDNLRQFLTDGTFVTPVVAPRGGATAQFEPSPIDR